MLPRPPWIDSNPGVPVAETPVAPPPPVPPRRPRRRVWGCLLMAVGVAGLLTSAGGITRTLLRATGMQGLVVASTLTPTDMVAATPLPFPATPTAQPVSPTPAITLPANIAVPPLCDGMTPTPAPTPPSTPAPTCTPCPLAFTAVTATPDQVKVTLDAAAAAYHLPRYLVEGISQRESGLDPAFISCSFDIGLMQLKYGYWQWIDLLTVPSCELTATSYSPYIMAENAMLGAKLLAYLTCYYSYAGDEGGTLAMPGKGTVAYWYKLYGLPYPDSAQSGSLCAPVFHDPRNPVYAALPALVGDDWSCPYSAKAGDTTLLDVVIATYNQGIGTTNDQGIQNGWYVTSTEQDIVQLSHSTS